MVKEGLINLDFADVRAIMRGMGKAMMGTGEATGEKRANRAAEAAIANPLLDDVSMKGARGLLISITGGRDLTLYEVDEAATRIREEVDQDANIILGATFDEALEGIIRVSVVATGIDQALIAKAPELSATEQRIAEVAERLRAEARARVVQPAPAPAPAPRIVNQPEPAAPKAVEPAPFADIAAAPVASPIDDMAPLTLGDDSALAPQPRQAAVFAPPAPPPVAEQPPVPMTPFIPPQAERPIRPARMPRVEDLPVPAQNQLRATRGEIDAASHDQKRMTLLQRLATVGFGRKDEGAGHPAGPPETHAGMARPIPDGSQRPPVSPVHAEYTKRPLPPGYRPAQGALDPHGRPLAQPRGLDDEQLEIPAFLRRQTN
jgi:cell division protein FtsZ